jgi:hypothetical protein
MLKLPTGAITATLGILLGRTGPHHAEYGHKS